MVDLRTLPLDQLAAIMGTNEYDAMKYVEYVEKNHNGIIPVIERFPKKEAKKRETIFKILDSLPCTQAVASRKTGLSKSIINDYLKKLETVEIDKDLGLDKIGAVKKLRDNYCEMDVYFNSLLLNSKRTKPDAENKEKIWEMWHTRDEYKIASFVENKLNSAIRLNLKGKTWIKVVPLKKVKKEVVKTEKVEKQIIPNAKAQQKAIENFKKTHVAIPWTLLEEDI